MDDLFAIFQGLGLALCCGLGGPLAALAVAVLAHVHAGIDLRGTDLQWFGRSWFIPVLAVLTAAWYLLAKRRPPAIEAPVAAALGAIVFAASLAEETSTWWPGLIAGAVAGYWSASVTAGIREGALRRGGDDVGGGIALLLSAAAVALAAATIFCPPLGLVLLVVFAYVAATRGRRASEKHAGLRSLR